jgi:hypothetical protein
MRPSVPGFSRYIRNLAGIYGNTRTTVHPAKQEEGRGPEGPALSWCEGPAALEGVSTKD